MTSPDPEGERPGDAAERPLAGGLDQAGAVVRVGNTVRRPGGPNAEPVRALLQHLRRSGFVGAPRPLGVDEQGREVLEFLPGAVALPPFPDWAADEELLVSVAELQRQLHRATADFRLPDGLSWAVRRLPTGAEGALVCHTDLCLENVVVRSGRAAAFIDFDLALPVSRLFDIAVAARHWIPLRDPVDIADARAGTDLGARFGRFAATHGLATEERHRVVDLTLRFLEVSLVDIEQRAAAGHPGYARMWAADYPGMNHRSRRWLHAHRAELVHGHP